MASVPNFQAVNFRGQRFLAWSARESLISPTVSFVSTGRVADRSEIYTGRLVQDCTTHRLAAAEVVDAEQVAWLLPLMIFGDESEGHEHSQIADLVTSSQNLSILQLE